MIGSLWYQLLMCLCMRSPEHENDVLVLHHQMLDDCLGKGLPPFARVGHWLVCSHSESSV